MKIAIGVPNNLESRNWNGFLTLFGHVKTALQDHDVTVFAPGGGDVVLEGELKNANDPFNQYHNTVSLSRDFAAKVGKTDHDAILAFNSMGLFLSENHIYHTSNVPYKKVFELVKDEYPENEHYRKLLDYYEFVGNREKENYEKAGKIIVNSRKIEEHIAEQGIDPEKIFYVPRAIPKLYSNKERKKEKMKIVLMPAELRVMKGVGYAIETMKILKKKMPNVVLIICGRMNYYEKDYMKQLISDARGKANIIVTGFVPKKQLHGYINMAECAFMPFCFDECPISLSECIGHGLPVVTNEYAGFEKKVINQFGYCADYKDINDYAEGLMKILSDDHLRKEKSDGAKKITDQFNFDFYKKEINNVFEEFGKG